MMPKLPTPETVDGNRLMYTRSQMVEYGEACAVARIMEIDASRAKHNTSGQPKTDIPDFMRGMMGMMGMKP